MQRTRVRFPRKVHALNIFAKNFLMIYFEKHAYTHGIFKLLLIFEVIGSELAPGLGKH
jgi:hypothetical protein